VEASQSPRALECMQMQRYCCSTLSADCMHSPIKCGNDAKQARGRGVWVCVGQVRKGGRTGTGSTANLDASRELDTVRAHPAVIICSEHKARLTQQGSFLSGCVSRRPRCLDLDDALACPEFLRRPAREIPGCVSQWAGRHQIASKQPGIPTSSSSYLTLIHRLAYHRILAANAHNGHTPQLSFLH
jgi:hypothetical protein